MKTLIYQYWDGEMTSGNKAGMELMSLYAKKIGADYKFELNPKWQKNLGQYTPHYGAFKPIFDDKMNNYDYVLFADTDVIPVDNLEENIFHQFLGTDYEIGICKEHLAPEIRKNSSFFINNINDEKWCKIIEDNFKPVKMPRTKNGLPEVFNSGVVVYSKFGMEKFRKNHIQFRDYVSLIKKSKLPNFYQCDQTYLHAMLEICKFKWKVMDYKWNSSVHYKTGTSGENRPVNDFRFENTNFVHIQLNGADNFDFEKIKRIANKPIEEW